MLCFVHWNKDIVTSRTDIYYSQNFLRRCYFGFCKIKGIIVHTEASSRLGMARTEAPAAAACAAACAAPTCDDCFEDVAAEQVCQTCHLRFCPAHAAEHRTRKSTRAHQLEALGSCNT